MVLEFRKKRAITPGTYAIILNGTEVGMIIGEPRMEPSRWRISERYQYHPWFPRWEMGQHIFSTLKDAKRYIVRNKKRLPGK